MRKKNQEPGSFFLGDPFYTLKSPRPVGQFFFGLVLVALGGLGAFGSLYAPFPIVVVPSVLVILGIFSAVLFSLLFTLKRWKLPISLFLGAVYGFALWRFFESVKIGAIITVNRVLLGYAWKTDRVFPQILLDGRVPQEPYAHEVTLFAIFLIVPVLYLLCAAFFKGRSPFLCFLCTGLFVAVPMVFSIRPPAWVLGSLFAYWAALLLLSGPYTNRGAGRKGNSFGIPGGRAVPNAALLLLPLVALGLFALSRAVSPEAYRRDPGVQQIRSTILEGDSISLFRSGGVGNSTGRVNVNQSGNREYTGETMLRVKSDGAMLSYYKSFAGSVYTGSSWEGVSQETEEEMAEAYGDYLPQLMPDAFARELPMRPMGRYSFSVDNVAANPRCIFLPYGVTRETVTENNLVPRQDGYFRGENTLFGLRQYEGESLPYVDYYILPSRTQLAVGEMPFSFPAGTYHPSSFSAQIAALYSLPLDETAERLVGESYYPLLESATEYSPLAYEANTQVPEELRPFLEAYLEENLDKEVYHESMMDFISIVVNLVRKSCEYTLSPGSLPAGKDFVRYFLEENKKGYCVHFATTVALLLRTLGIPARYAEGYVAPDTKGEWVDIRDYNAHAWVELYFSGSGWVPIEVTPGVSFDDPTHSPERTYQEKNPTPTPAASPTPEPTEEPTIAPETSSTPAPTLPPDEQGGGSAGGWSIPLWLLLVPCALLAAFLALFGNYRLRLLRRKERLYSGEANRRALALYAFGEKLISYGKRHGVKVADAPERILELAERARFSQHTLTGEELRELEAYVKSRQELLAHRLPDKARILGRYFWVYL